MAKVVSPLHSVEASGKSDGLVYARNQHGQYTRDYTAPTDPNTADQQTWRDAFSDLSGWWESNLTQEERDAWNSFGENFPAKDRFGRNTRRSGRNWYISYNIFRVAAGFADRETPPVNTGNTYLPDYSLTQNEDGIVLVVDPEPVGDQFIYVSKIPAQNLGRSFPPNDNNFSRFIKSTDSSPFVVRADNELTTTQKRYFFRIVSIDGNGKSAAPIWLYRDAIAAETFVSNAYDYINSLAKNSNVCNFPDSYVGDSGIDERTICRVDISSSAATPPVTNAFLRITQTGPGNDMLSEIFGLKVSTTNCSITWNTGFSSPGGVAGTDYDSSAQDNWDASAQYATFDLDISDWVNDVLAGTRTNYGLFMKGANGGTQNTLYGTYLNSTAAYRPTVYIID